MWLVNLLDCPYIEEVYRRFRRNFDFLPHVPTLILSCVFWWFYQVYACGHLAFIEESGWKHAVFSVLVCGGIGMTAASVYATTLQRYPLHPKKFAVNPDFEELSTNERSDLFEKVIAETGANTHHVTKICDTCLIVKPERAHHCAICDIYKCIHYKNQKQFALFFFWLCFSVAVAVTSFHPYVMRSSESQDFKYSLSFKSITNVIISYSILYNRYLGPTYNMGTFTIRFLVINSILAYFLFIIFSVVFVNFMWFCVIRSGTIVACNKSTRFGRKFPGIYIVESRTRCFQKPTVIENIQVIFGKRYSLWLIPVANNDSDGWLHSCTCSSNQTLL